MPVAIEKGGRGVEPVAGEGIVTKEVDQAREKGIYEKRGDEVLAKQGEKRGRQKIGSEGNLKRRLPGGGPAIRGQEKRHRENSRPRGKCPIRPKKGPLSWGIERDVIDLWEGVSVRRET